jgi:hypothetical protein
LLSTRYVCHNTVGRDDTEISDKACPIFNSS